MSSAALLARRPDIYIDHRNIVDGTDVDPPRPVGSKRERSAAPGLGDIFHTRTLWRITASRFISEAARRLTRPQGRRAASRQ